jgi:phenylacetate-CoA ligase
MSSALNTKNSDTINGSLASVFETLVYAKEHSLYYQRTLKDFTFDKADFSVEMIQQLPFTTKEDISVNNTDFLAVPMNQVAEFCTTSGTSGEPITMYLTKQDLTNLASNEARSFRLTGASSDDIFQLMTTIDKQFMAGLAYYLGVQELNAGMVRIGPGVPAMQWKSIFLNKPTVLIAVPSFIINLIDFAKNNGIDYTNSSVRSIICIGEAIREDDLTLNVLGKRITDAWDVQLFSTYASTEMGAAFTECTEQKGCHLNDDLLYLEVLNDDGQEVGDGETGEVVVTTLGRTGTPLIRYKTGDIARVYRTSCACGDRSPRLGPIIGRKNQMIKYKGTTIFPNSIFEIFDGIPEVTCYKVEISKDYLGNDAITILLEKKIEFSGKLTDIVEECRSRLRVVPHFVFLENDYLRSQVYKSNIRKPEKIVFK